MVEGQQLSPHPYPLPFLEEDETIQNLNRFF